MFKSEFCAGGLQTQVIFVNIFGKSQHVSNLVTKFVFKCHYHNTCDGGKSSTFLHLSVGLFLGLLEQNHCSICCFAIIRNVKKKCENMLVT